MISLLPLPALRGERVGVRGSFGKFDLWRIPLTRIASQSDLSPQAGRGDHARFVVFTSPHAAMAAIANEISTL